MPPPLPKVGGFISETIDLRGLKNIISTDFRAQGDLVRKFWEKSKLVNRHWLMYHGTHQLVYLSATGVTLSTTYWIEISHTPIK